MLEALVTGGDAVLGTEGKKIRFSVVFFPLFVGFMQVYVCLCVFVCVHVCVFEDRALTYGVAGRGERRDRSVWRWVELLLDFGADNPGKVNNRRINQ